MGGGVGCLFGKTMSLGFLGLAVSAPFAVFTDVAAALTSTNAPQGSLQYSVDFGSPQSVVAFLQQEPAVTQPKDHFNTTNCSDMFDVLDNQGLPVALKSVHVSRWHLLGQILMYRRLQQGKDAKGLMKDLEAVADAANPLVGTNGNGIMHSATWWYVITMPDLKDIPSLCNGLMNCPHGTGHALLLRRCLPNYAICDQMNNSMRGSSCLIQVHDDLRDANFTRALTNDIAEGLTHAMGLHWDLDYLWRREHYLYPCTQYDVSAVAAWCFSWMFQYGSRAPNIKPSRSGAVAPSLSRALALFLGPLAWATSLPATCHENMKSELTLRQCIYALSGNVGLAYVLRSQDGMDCDRMAAMCPNTDHGFPQLGCLSVEFVPLVENCRAADRSECGLRQFVQEAYGASSVQKSTLEGTALALLTLCHGFVSRLPYRELERRDQLRFDSCLDGFRMYYTSIGESCGIDLMVMQNLTYAHATRLSGARFQQFCAGPCDLIARPLGDLIREGSHSFSLGQD